MVECSPATRAARVRFPADANILFHSVVVITLASHARFPGFETQWNHSFFAGQAGMKKYSCCQKWDSNPRPEDRTAT